ncbi:MAG TPA: Hsp20/alpha crystallin family protein [Puia sp.]|nr:Hsp20/alpha crystallin family protein [Puia sp.]
MSIVKFNSQPVHRGFNNLFDEFFNELPAFTGREWSGWTFPPVNIHETPDAYHLELSVPGRAKDDFKVNIENGLLTVSFEKKEENKTEDYKTVRKEFSFRSFKRSFNLDEKIDAEKIEAKYENGLLKLHLPKKEQTKEATKQITIN